MKLKYYMLSLALAATASVSFTSCSDDDDVVVVDELVVPTDVQRVKIGTENRVALPVVQGAGQYNAYSLDPAVVEVVEDGGNLYLEGYKNGNTSVVISDAAGTYKRINVSVYTTEVMKLSHETLEFNVPMGLSSSTNECSVLEGNGEYTIKTDNDKVNASIDAETGAISLRAKAGAQPYTAKVTVNDASGLEATMNVTVVPSLDGWTQGDIDEILAINESMVYGDCKDPSDGTVPYYFNYRNYYGAFVNEDADGTRKLGWWMNQWGSDYGGLRIEIPSTAKVGEEVSGKLFYQYSSKSWYDCYQYEGTAKVVEDNSTRVVVIFWNADMVNERINRGYVVIYK